MAETPEQTSGATTVEAPKKNTRKPKVKVNSVYPKLLEIRKTVDYLQKTARGGQFNYTSSSQVLAAVRNEMNEQGILLVAAVVNTRLISTPNRNQVLSHFTELDMVMEWVDVETGDTVAIPWYGQGVDLAGEKGVGKALTYAEKYFILKQFNIPTDKDDPDSFQEKNLPQTDVKNTLIVQLAEAKDIQVVANIWAHNPDYQSDKEFKQACGDAKKRLAPEEPEPKPDSKSEGDAGE